jgi:transcriptional regulator with XRE-family HTH domain
MDEGYGSYLAAIGNSIKARRRECGLSLRDMVIVHGCNDSQWRRYERGAGLALPSLVKVAVILQTTPSALLDGIPLPDLDQLATLRTPQEKPRGLRPSEIAARSSKAS